MKLIDADKLLGLMSDPMFKEGFRETMKIIIKNTPTVDAVPVVRCEECSNKEEHSYYCLLHSIFTSSDFFCKDGGCE